MYAQMGVLNKLRPTWWCVGEVIRRNFNSHKQIKNTTGRIRDLPAKASKLSCRRLLAELTNAAISVVFQFEAFWASTLVTSICIVTCVTAFVQLVKAFVKICSDKCFFIGSFNLIYGLLLQPVILISIAIMTVFGI